MVIIIFFFFFQISEFFNITPKIERAKSLDENDDQEPMSDPMRIITESENEKVTLIFFCFKKVFLLLTRCLYAKENKN